MEKPVSKSDYDIEDDIEAALVKTALEEDLGREGDVTSESIFSRETGIYCLISKDTGILCGTKIFSRVYSFLDPSVKITLNYQDSDKIKPGDIIAEIEGSVVSILKAERTSINFISFLSAIATKTAQFTEKAKGRVKILDTRKTIPGFRKLSKYAVRCGGGKNHRTGLYDMALLKDTHIDAAGSIAGAVEKIRYKYGSSLDIEVEARNPEEVKAALKAGADRIMLDNMSDSDMAEAVCIIGNKAETEASGNMTIERIDAVAETGVDYISIGELTHSIKAFDFSLKKKRENIEQ